VAGRILSPPCGFVTVNGQRQNSSGVANAWRFTPPWSRSA